MNTPIAVLLSHKGSAVYTVDGRASVAEAVQEMSLRNVGSVVVIQGGRLVGILTEHDVISRVVAAGRQPDLTYVSDAMTRQPVIISPRATVSEAMTLFLEKRCRQIPVVDDDTGQMIGLVSLGDVNQWLIGSQQNEVDQLRQYISGGYGGS